jgi:hypothetical protein
MSWIFKSAVSTIKEASKDFQVVAAAASKEIKKATGQYKLNLESTKNFQGVAEYLQEFLRNNEADVTGVLRQILSNPTLVGLLRDNLSNFPTKTPGTSPETNFLYSFSNFVSKKFRGDEIVWIPLLLNLFQSDPLSLKDSLEFQTIQLFWRNPEEENLTNECLKKVRDLRLRKETLKTSTETNRLESLYLIARVCKEIHEILSESETLIAKTKEKDHERIADTLSAVEIAHSKVEKNLQECDNRMSELNQKLKQLNQQSALAQESHEDDEKFTASDKKINELVGLVGSLQNDLNKIIGQISSYREEKIQVENSIVDVQKSINTTKLDLLGILEAEKLQMSKISSLKEKTALFSNSMYTQLLRNTEELASITSPKTSETGVPATSRYFERARLACEDLMNRRLAKLKDVLDEVKKHGAVTDSTEEREVHEVIALARKADLEFEEFKIDYKQFYDFLGKIQEIFQEATSVYDEICHYSEPFKIKFAEIAVVKSLAEEAVIESRQNSPKHGAPAAVAAADAGDDLGIKRKDSFEDLLGI